MKSYMTQKDSFKRILEVHTYRSSGFIQQKHRRAVISIEIRFKITVSKFAEFIDRHYASQTFIDERDK